MNVALSGAAAGGAAAAAIANAVKASGAIVRLAPEELQRLLARADDALVVYSPRRGRFGSHRYLFAWRGFVFHTSTRQELALGGHEVVVAERVWVPG